MVAAANSRSESTRFMLALMFSMLGSIMAALVLSAQYRLLVAPGGEAEDCFFLAESKPQTDRARHKTGATHRAGIEQCLLQLSAWSSIGCRIRRRALINQLFTWSTARVIQRGKNQPATFQAPAAAGQRRRRRRQKQTRCNEYVNFRIGLCLWHTRTCSRVRFVWAAIVLFSSSVGYGCWWVNGDGGAQRNKKSLTIWELVSLKPSIMQLLSDCLSQRCPLVLYPERNMNQFKAEKW